MIMETIIWYMDESKTEEGTGVFGPYGVFRSDEQIPQLLPNGNLLY